MKLTKPARARMARSSQLISVFARRMLRRGLDVVVGSALLALLTPAFAMIATAIKATGGAGPVFDRQVRVGTSGKAFQVWRFRCEPHEPEGQGGSVLASKGAEIVVGAWLRRNNLDRLPRLINVVLGDMSLAEVLGHE